MGPLYTSSDLLAIRNTTARLPVETWIRLKELKLCNPYPTHRGTRAGKQKHRNIQVVDNRYRQARSVCCPPKQLTIHKKNLIQPEMVKWNLPVLMFTNTCGGLVSKLDELDPLCKDTYTGICCITETWLTSKVPDQCITMKGYNTFRRDRKDGRTHGGIVCYVRETTPVTRVWTEFDSKNSRPSGLQ